MNPQLRERGLLMVYNPCDEAVTRTLKIPLYYTGLTGSAKVRIGDRVTTVALDPRGNADLPVTVPARGQVAIVVEAP